MKPQQIQHIVVVSLWVAAMGVAPALAFALPGSYFVDLGLPRLTAEPV